jgi:hypothetical protein
MNIIRLIQVVLSFLAVFLTYSSGNAAEKCPNVCLNEASLECLEINFDKLYHDNYELFWDILHSAAKKAKACDSVEGTAAFLRLAILKQSNAEFTEFFNQTIEQLCLEESKCLLDGLLMVTQYTKVKLLDKLRTPLFMDSSKIDQVFLKARTDNEYKEISDIYFGKK